MKPDKKIRMALRVAKRAGGGRTVSKNGLYSKAEEIANELPQQKGNVDQMLAMMAKRGVKPSELMHAGRPFGDSISKDELAAHFRDKAPKLQITRLERDDEDGPTQYNDYALSGGHNYREHLLHLPSRNPDSPLRFKQMRGNNGEDRLRTVVPFGDYASPHWRGIPNIVAHARMQDFVQPLRTPEYEAAENEYAKAMADRGASHKALMRANREYNEDVRNGRDYGESSSKNIEASQLFNKAASKGVQALKFLESFPLEKILHLEELQSDWGQEGRKKGFYDPDKPHQVFKWSPEMGSDTPIADFATAEEAKAHAEGLSGSDGMYGVMNFSSGSGSTGNRVPRGPFVTNTQHWTDLGLKHLLHEVAKGKYDKISWTPGQEHVGRYGLENHVGRLAYDPDSKFLEVYTPNGDLAKTFEGVGRNEISDLVGEELSKKLLDTTPTPYSSDGDPALGGAHVLSGLDLKVGGEGMKKYYDEILPKSLLKLARQHDPDARLVPHTIRPKQMDTVEKRDLPFVNTHALEITPKMRESILKGQSLFSHGGMVQKYASGGAVDPDPTDAQKEVGNYKKEHVSFQGLPVSIENKKGSYRSGIAPNGRHWSVKMPYDYGYVKGTEGADGDHVDVCIGPDADSDSVFVVDQKNLNTGKFDEHKAMLGYSSLIDAEKAYISGFSDGKGHLRMGPVIRMTVAEFKKWVKTNGTKIANKKQSLVDDALKLIRR